MVISDIQTSRYKELTEIEFRDEIQDLWHLFHDNVAHYTFIKSGKFDNYLELMVRCGSVSMGNITHYLENKNEWKLVKFEPSPSSPVTLQLYILLEKLAN